MTPQMRSVIATFGLSLTLAAIGYWIGGVILCLVLLGVGMMIGSVL